jgi:hypothetical protein
MTPTLQPDVSLWLVLAYAALNPATIWVAVEMGRRVDQPIKLVVAGFAAAIAGFLLLFALAWFRVPFAGTIGRAASGVTAASFAFGIAWAFIGQMLFRRSPPRP